MHQTIEKQTENISCSFDLALQTHGTHIQYSDLFLLLFRNEENKFAAYNCSLCGKNALQNKTPLGLESTKAN